MRDSMDNKQIHNTVSSLKSPPPSNFVDTVSPQENRTTQLVVIFKVHIVGKRTELLESIYILKSHCYHRRRRSQTLG